jgi:hypothetical protein
LRWKAQDLMGRLKRTAGPDGGLGKGLQDVMERRTTKNLGRSSTAGYCSQTGQEIPKNRVINLKKSRKHAEFADLDGPSW